MVARAARASWLAALSALHGAACGGAARGSSGRGELLDAPPRGQPGDTLRLGRVIKAVSVVIKLICFWIEGGPGAVVEGGGTGTATRLKARMSRSAI